MPANLAELETAAPHDFGDVLYTTKQAAEILGVHEKSLARARSYGGPLSRLLHVRVGGVVRYRRSEIERYLRANTARFVDQHAA